MTRQKQPKLNLHTYPKHEPVSERVGIKVAWQTFATLKEAEEIAKVARQNAQELARFGYDYGYQSPGSITKTKDGYEVCLP